MGREMINTSTNQKQQSTMAYTVEQLVSANPYNPDILPDLENYVNEQVSSQTYSLNANLCLLRLYQFEPERMSTQIVARILIKALMAMPAQDFSLCLFLIPERVQMEDQFKTLIVLSHLLETARFRQFWDEAAKSRHILEVVPGFEQAIQEYAIHVLSLTYQKVPRTVLAEAINIEGLALDKFLESHIAAGWSLQKNQDRGQLIILPRNEFNHPELKRTAADGPDGDFQGVKNRVVNLVTGEDGPLEIIQPKEYLYNRLDLLRTMASPKNYLETTIAENARDIIKASMIVFRHASPNVQNYLKVLQLVFWLHYKMSQIRRAAFPGG